MKGENDTTIPKHYGEDLNLKWLDKDHVPGQSDIGVFKWGHDDSCQCVEFSHDGDFVASGSCDGYVCIWDPKTTDCVSTLDHREKWVFDVKFSPDDYQLATAAADCAARLWQIKDPTTGKITDDPYVVRVLQEHTNWVTATLFFRGGKNLMTCSADKTVRLWDIDKGVAKDVGRRHSSWINDIAIDESERILACASADKRVSLWEVGTNDTLNCIRTLLQHRDWVMKVIFTKEDSNILLSVSKDATVCIWNVKDQQLLKVMDDGHEAPILSICQSNINRQGIRHLITSSEDKTCMFWNLKNQAVARQGRRKKHSVGHTGPIYDVACSPDGAYFATACEDTSVRIWNAITCVCLKKLEHREDNSWKDDVM